MTGKLENIVKSGDFLKFSDVYKGKVEDNKLLDVFNKLREKLDLEPINILTDSNQKDDDYGCLILFFPIPHWDDLLDHIDENDVYDDEDNEYGFEYEPHCTILYGFNHYDSIVDDIRKYVDVKKYKVELNGISFFETDDYDVLKFDLVSEELSHINKNLRDNFKYTNDYDGYNPHLTIVYLKKGCGKKYSDLFELSRPITLSSSAIKYSFKNRNEKINEREIKFMDGAIGVEVKDECKLGGLPNGKSKQCNQGDINALKLKKI